MTAPAIDVLIVTALQLERRAVRHHLASIEALTINPIVLDVGKFSTAHRSMRVAVLESGPGNIDASALTALTTFRVEPPVVLMVGIAGGIKDVALGDVVASSKIYWLESGKSTDIKVKSRPDFGPVSMRLVQLARQVAVDEQWQARIDCSDGPQPSAFVEPIVAGERVLASTRSQDAQRIRDDFSDAVAVAMEDMGVTVASVIGGADDTLAIRGVSDLLDGKALADEGGSQLSAAANAAAFAFELLTKLEAPGKPDSGVDSTSRLISVAAQLYPKGPTDRSVWERAGGDIGKLTLSGTGDSIWFAAVRELKQGGGGPSIDVRRLVEVMVDDYPNNAHLQALVTSLEPSDPRTGNP